MSDKIRLRGGGPGHHEPIVFPTPEDLEQKIQAYFDHTDTEFLTVYHKQLTREGSDLVKMPIRRPYTVEGLALFLNTSRQVLINYQKRPEYADIIRRAKDRISLDQIERTMVGELNPALIKFNLINNSDYKDEKSIDHTSLGEKMVVTGMQIVKE